LLLCHLVTFHSVHAEDVVFGAFTWPDRGVSFYSDPGLPDDVGTVEALEVHTDGKLYVGGLFYYVGDAAMPSSCIAAWNGESWQQLNSTPGGHVFTILSVTSDLYAGGGFTAINGVPASRIARWDGQNWHPLGVGTNSGGRTMVTRQENGMPVLYAGGDFMGAGGQTARHVARWDGATWSALGTGTSGGVHGMAFFLTTGRGRHSMCVAVSARLAGTW